MKLESVPSKESVINDISDAIRKQIPNADDHYCGDAATFLVRSLDIKFVSVPLSELTPERISSTKLSQYSNNRFDEDIKLDFDDYPLIDSSLKRYIDNSLGGGIMNAFTIRMIL